VKRQWSILSLILVCFLGCSSVPVDEPSGPIARFGTTPTIDGVFEDGEWDDATIVHVDNGQQFRIKHDNTNLYFAVGAAGGDLRFNTNTGLRVLHWSAQLGSAEYIKSDTSTQSLDKPFAYELWGLQDESPAVIHETLAGYLAENGWAANIAPMGSLTQSELVVSFDWLGVDIGSGRFVEIPGVRIGCGLLMSRSDPRAEKIMALPPEERERLYPGVFWPSASVPHDSIGMGVCPETIRIDPADFGKIWIDLQR